MKFVSLRTKLADRPNKFNASSRAVHIQTYAELRQQIHNDLRSQHPEWVQSDGRSPICDSYESRLTELLNSLKQKESTPSIVDPHRLLEQGAH
jgi:hypothetical protein